MLIRQHVTFSFYSVHSFCFTASLYSSNSLDISLSTLCFPFVVYFLYINTHIHIHREKNNCSGEILKPLSFPKQQQGIYIYKKGARGQQAELTHNISEVTQINFSVLLSSKHPNDQHQRLKLEAVLFCARLKKSGLFYISFGRYEEPLNGSLLFMGSNEVRSILVCGTGLH